MRAHLYPSRPIRWLALALAQLDHGRRHFSDFGPKAHGKLFPISMSGLKKRCSADLPT